MNLLQHSLVEEAGHDNGFEHVLLGGPEGYVVMGSARHPAEVAVEALPAGYRVTLGHCHPGLPDELALSFPEAVAGICHTLPSIGLSVDGGRNDPTWASSVRPAFGKPSNAETIISESSGSGRGTGFQHYNWFC